jgi:hypothetical protein
LTHIDQPNHLSWRRRSRPSRFRRGPTDFERVGLAGATLVWPRRDWLLSVDADAYHVEHTDAWCAALDRWAAQAQRTGLRFSIFLSLEEVLQARATDRPAYERFGASLRRLADAGCDIHPHNHCLFDPQTGTPVSPAPLARVVGYRKRPSFVYDVVRRHGVDLTDWLQTVLASYDSVLAEIGVPRPQRLAFRAGGFDAGSTEDELRAYVAALSHCGFEFDSSASRGEFGTRSDRFGAPFPDNAYELAGGPIEVAPCWHVDCGAPALSRSWAGSMRALARQRRSLRPSRKGVLVTVLHFDHLFHHRDGAGYDYFAVTDAAEIERRVDRFFSFLERWQRLLGVENVCFSDLPTNVEGGAAVPAALAAIA